MCVQSEFAEVVTLLDMLRFAAENFWQASQVLTELREHPGLANRPDRARDMLMALQNLSINLRALDLPVSVREIEKFNQWMNPFVRELAAMPLEKQKEEFLKSEPIVATKLENLSSVIHSELESRAFFHLRQDQASLYDQKELFGAGVNSKFPTIQYDMVEAGNCYAVGRSTACVFHLMRIMEVGVRKFGTKLGVSLAEEKNWQNILDEINREIKKLPPKNPETIAMSAASANLFAVKLAWRNQVMHPNDTYTPEEARNLIGLAKMFMEQLLTVL